MKMKTKSKKIIISVIIVAVALAVAGTVYAAVIRPKTLREVGYANEQSGFKEFAYTLKNNYKSRDDVIKEITNLTDAFKSNIDGCSPEYVENASKKYTNLYDKLQAKLENFPAAEISVDKARKEYIYEIAEFWEGELKWNQDNETSKRLCTKRADIISKYESGEYTLYEAYEQMMAVKLPSYDNLYDEYKYCEEKYYENEKKGYAKELYETASDIMEKYKNGELTLEQACDQMDYLKYPADGMLLTNIIYEQKEKEQGNPTYF